MYIIHTHTRGGGEKFPGVGTTVKGEMKLLQYLTEYCYIVIFMPTKDGAKGLQ